MKNKNIVYLIIVIVLVIVVGAYLLKQSNISPKKDIDTTSTNNSQIQDNTNTQINEENQSSLKDDRDLVFNFSAQNNSGLSGTATLSESGGKAKVALNLKNSILGGVLTPEKPAHVHFGNCSNIGGVKYSLNSVMNGKSETILNVSLAELKAGLPLSINVHKSASEMNIFVACTDLIF